MGISVAINSLKKMFSYYTLKLQNIYLAKYIKPEINFMDALGHKLNYRHLKLEKFSFKNGNLNGIHIIIFIKWQKQQQNITSKTK